MVIFPTTLTTIPTSGSAAVLDMCSCQSWRSQSPWGSSRLPSRSQRRLTKYYLLLFNWRNGRRPQWKNAAPCCFSQRSDRNGAVAAGERFTEEKIRKMRIKYKCKKEHTGPNLEKDDHSYVFRSECAYEGLFWPDPFDGGCTKWPPGGFPKDISENIFTHLWKNPINSFDCQN